jgi:vacuolar-type H+-ATPase subunit E/Vma4
MTSAPETSMSEFSTPETSPPGTAAVASSTDPPTLFTHLDPVRQALLDDARVEADRIRTEARRHADEVVADAEREVAAEVAEVARRHAIAAAAHADQVRARARAEAHTEMLSAREDVRQNLLEAVRLAALGLRDDDRYPALLDHFETVARARLGADAHVERDPLTGGGVVASAGTRRVDYTLTALAGRVLQQHADEVAALWA